MAVSAMVSCSPMARSWSISRSLGSAQPLASIEVALVSRSNDVLARATTDAQKAQVGNQAGGRVWLFLETDDLMRDHDAWLAAGVRFRETPRHETYGKVVVFEDLYGNAWDLIEPATGA